MLIADLQQPKTNLNGFTDRGNLSSPRIRRDTRSDSSSPRNDSGFLSVIYSSGATSLADMARRFSDTMNNVSRFISNATSIGNFVLSLYFLPKKRD